MQSKPLIDDHRRINWPREKPDKLCESWKLENPDGAVAQTSKQLIIGGGKSEGWVTAGLFQGDGRRKKNVWTARFSIPSRGSASTPHPQRPQEATDGENFLPRTRCAQSDQDKKLTPELEKQR